MRYSLGNTPLKCDPMPNLWLHESCLICADDLFLGWLVTYFLVLCNRWSLKMYKNKLPCSEEAVKVGCWAVSSEGEGNFPSAQCTQQWQAPPHLHSAELRLCAMCENVHIDVSRKPQEGIMPHWNPDRLLTAVDFFPMFVLVQVYRLNKNALCLSDTLSWNFFSPFVIEVTAYYQAFKSQIYADAFLAISQVIRWQNISLKSSRLMKIYHLQPLPWSTLKSLILDVHTGIK